MFSTILVANRGEIACRVIRTARRMGIRTVAVSSEADLNARHVRLADEAVLIGPAPARESYLVIEKIIDAARRTSAQAIHPGYGFLSENADFAEACAANGLVFIGPPASAMRAMGRKSAARSLMERAGVPLTPGYHGDSQDPAFLKTQADGLGYPVLIKASAGGGGKGMRRVDRGEDVAEALASCRREAESAFGDGTVLIEKYLLRPRHIEIQVFGDTYGDCVFLFERDCSVQRRYQKVIEEAPAPGMTPERRAAMGRAAVEAARAVRYVGAGTVEFIVGQDGSFYFMEMNTRLQVEHPVTEMISGQDLVEWQLRVAAGERLPMKQEQLAFRGHAIEARIYAEDADKGFLPSTGRLVHLAPPAESVNVRVDTGVEEGDEIGPHYDPMIAKLIVWDETRDLALARMQKALADYRVVGVTANIGFLSRLIACPAFAGADLDTGLIERQRDVLFPEIKAPATESFLVATLAELVAERDRAAEASGLAEDRLSPWATRDGWRLNLQARGMLSWRTGDQRIDVSVSYRPDAWMLACRGETVLARAHRNADGSLAIELDDRRMVANVVATADRQRERRHVFILGACDVIERDDPLHSVEASGQHDAGMTAPMPGKVVALLAQPGTTVDKGTPLLILEAMKMEHTITAPAAGLVKGFRYAAGDQVIEGAALLDFEAAS